MLNAPANNTISLAQLGPSDTTPPFPLEASSISANAFPNSVEFQWPGAADDANGTGVFLYRVKPNNVSMTGDRGRYFIDATVAPSTTYTYSFTAVDYPNNESAPVTVSVTTPPLNTVDPRRVGVRPEGAYWGDGGEQIDVRSGNLNYTLPLFKAMGRGGWGVSFALNYNSQLWRKDAGVTWKIGRDVGYGFGWKLLAGSVVPYWSDYWTISYRS